MKLSNINPLLSVLLLRTATNVASAKIPQIPINDVQTCPTPTNGNECGFRYPGVYRIINYGFQNAAALNGTGPNAAVVSMPWNITDPAQQWGISYTDNTDNEVMIFSQVNGAALSAVENRKVVRAVHTPPYDKRAHWVMDRNAFANVEGVPIVFTNRAIAGAVLDLSATNQAKGTPVLVYPKNAPVTRNQGWFLQIMGYQG